MSVHVLRFVISNKCLSYEGLQSFSSEEDSEVILFSFLPGNSSGREVARGSRREIISNAPFILLQHIFISTNRDGQLFLQPF